MLAVIQRVKKSSVTVEGRIVGEIGAGLLVLLGIARGDTTEDVDYLAEKTVNLRIFEDKNQKMNLSLKDIDGEMLVISQFTLLGDCRKGRRPSFVNAAAPETAKDLYEYFIKKSGSSGIKVQSGRFGAMMQVELINNGPVTLILESLKHYKP